MFFSNEYDAHLYTELDDISTLYWKPLWEEGSIKKPTESISYLYVPLVPEVVEKEENGSPPDVKAINQRKFIIVKKYNSQLDFSLASYFSNPEQDSVAADGTNLKNKHTGLNSMLLQTLSTNGESSSYVYRKKKNINKGDGNNTISSYGCTHTQVCDWNRHCKRGYIVTQTRSAPSRYYGQYQCPNPPYNGNLYSNTRWRKTRTYTESDCSFDNSPTPPPDPPPSNPPGGGGDAPDQNPNNGDPEPCETGNEVIDDKKIQDAFNELWEKSNFGTMENPNHESLRVERGGFIVPNNHGGHTFQPLKDNLINDSGPCFLDFRVPQNLPDGTIFVHTHPYEDGEEQKHCMPNKTLIYKGEINDVDKSTIGGMDVEKGLIIDANGITEFNEHGKTDEWSRCGY